MRTIVKFVFGLLGLCNVSNVVMANDVPCPAEAGHELVSANLKACYAFDSGCFSLWVYCGENLVLTETQEFDDAYKLGLSHKMQCEGHESKVAISHREVFVRSQRGEGDLWQKQTVLTLGTKLEKIPLFQAWTTGILHESALFEKATAPRKPSYLRR